MKTFCQLASAYKNMLADEYGYNEDGLRTSKNGIDLCSYDYRGNLLVEDFSMRASDNLYFHYDGNNDILGFTYKGVEASAKDGEYYYVKKLQGDIIGILNESCIFGINYRIGRCWFCER